MTYDETLGIMAVLKAAYPAYYRDMGRKDAESIVGLWTELLSDEPLDVVAAAVKLHIASDQKGFPPHVGAIRNAIVKLRQPEQMTELEAWALVSRAIRNGTYGAQAEFERLPPMLQRLVGSPEQLRQWAVMEQDEVQSVVASNFQRSFRARQGSERELLALPSNMRDFVGTISSGMALPALDEKW